MLLHTSPSNVSHSQKSLKKKKKKNNTNRNKIRVAIFSSVSRCWSDKKKAGGSPLSILRWLMGV